MSISLSIAAVTVQPPEGESLAQLAERLQAREEGALEILIERTQSACSRLAVSILKDPELSRDALQEAYFVVYQRIGQLRDPLAIKSWLFRIVTHCCHDILRRRGKEIQVEVEVAAAAPDLAEGVGRQETIRATFAQLPEIDRTTLALREVCSMSYEEMAAVLQVPLGTVRSRLAKARQRFIDKFKGVQHD
ncbi:MAG: RNA polymerase sigma factor [Candidatus Eremiobacteraeota bacterium]|nr:RNA polymerase sigma factor [Candidatus Eremiobacteraeota bacterium]